MGPPSIPKPWVTALVAVVHLAEPVGGGYLPIACGALAGPPAGLRPGRVVVLQDGRGRAVPAHLARRKGGFALHALLPPGDGLTRRILARRHPSAPEPRALRVTVSDRGVLVAGRPHPFSGGPGAEMSLGPLGISVCGGDVVSGAWRLLEANPLRAALLFEGVLAVGGGAGRLDLFLVARLHAASPRLDLDLSLRARAPTFLPRGVGLRLLFQERPKLVGAEGRILASGSGGRLARRRGEVFLTPSGPWKPPAPDRLEIDLREPLTLAGPGIAAADRLRLGAGTSSLEISRGGGGLHLGAGEGRILRFALVPGGGPAAGDPLVLPSLRPARLRGVPLPRGAGKGPGSVLLDQWAGPFLEDPWHGLRIRGDDAGDYLMPGGGMGNLEYDTTLGFMLRALTRGSLGSYRAARRAADHLLARDLDAARSGLFHMHGASHRSAGCEPGHHWVDGLVLLAAWSDDPLLELLVQEVLNGQLRTLAEAGLQDLQPRSLGWGLLALATGALASGEPGRQRRACRRWLRFLLKRQDPTGLFLLAPVAGEGEHFFENPYVQGGILGPALHRARRALGDGRVGPALGRLRRFLLAEAVRPGAEHPYLVWRLRFDAARHRVVARVGAAPGEHAALFAAGLLQASPTARRSAKLRALRKALPALVGPPRHRFIGSTTSLLMRSLPFL